MSRQGSRRIKWYIESTESGEITIAERLGTTEVSYICVGGVTRELRRCDETFVCRMIMDERVVGEQLMRIFVDKGCGIQPFLGPLETPHFEREVVRL